MIPDMDTVDYAESVRFINVVPVIPRLHVAGLEWLCSLDFFLWSAEMDQTASPADRAVAFMTHLQEGSTA